MHSVATHDLVFRNSCRTLAKVLSEEKPLLNLPRSPMPLKFNIYLNYGNQIFLLVYVFKQCWVQMITKMLFFMVRNVWQDPPVDCTSPLPQNNLNIPHGFSDPPQKGAVPMVIANFCFRERNITILGGSVVSMELHCGVFFNQSFFFFKPLSIRSWLFLWFWLVFNLAFVWVRRSFVRQSVEGVQIHYLKEVNPLKYEIWQKQQ